MRMKLSLLIGGVAAGLLAGGLWSDHTVRVAADKRAQAQAEDPAQNAVQQRNFAGTGDGEGITADSSNKYVCTAYQGKLPESPLTVNAGQAAGAIHASVAALYQGGQFSATTPTDSDTYRAATAAAASASTDLKTAADYAAAHVQLCEFAGLLKSGAAQMNTLAGRLSQGQATAADLAAAIHLADSLNQAGIADRSR